ncbi:MAG: hypothetical protein AAFX94_23665, partial [Myxococcota bacterium]
VTDRAVASSRSAGELVLDSTLDPRDSFAELNAAQSVGLSRALQAFFDDCDRDLSCTFGSGNAEFAFNNLLNRFSSPALREEATALSVTVTQGLGEERRWPGLASTLEQIDQGVLTPALASDPNKGQGDGTFFGTSCADSPIGSIQDLRAAEQLINAGEPVFARRCARRRHARGESGDLPGVQPRDRPPGREPLRGRCDLGFPHRPPHRHALPAAGVKVYRGYVLPASSLHLEFELEVVQLQLDVPPSGISLSENHGMLPLSRSDSREHGML